MKKIIAIIIILLTMYIAFSMYRDTQPAVSEKVQEAKKVAITFDDGPHKKYTKLLLDGLKERDVVATFFLIGKSIEGKEELVKQMEKDGHLVGNHTYSHIQLGKVEDDEACAEIWKTNTAIYDITEEMPCYIRPPFGEWNEDLSCAVDMNVVMWDVDPQDWKYKNAAQITQHVVNHVEDGDIILLHDVYKTSVEAALQIIDILSEEGYEFVTVEELIFD